MPTTCIHFRLLSQRLQELATKFVDDQVKAEAADPATFQPDLDRLAAFRLLVHAEIEDFLEAKAKDNVQAIATRIAAGRWMRASPELLSVAVALKRVLPVEDTLDTQRHVAFATELLGSAKGYIADNNGVKAQSFTVLSLCAGKTLDEVDGVLSAGLNSFGKNRGDVAHKSVTRCNSLQAPSTELQNAKALVSQIGTYFDVAP